MKKRISILIEQEVLKQTKLFAVKEGRRFSDVIHDALVSYLRMKPPDPIKRREAYKLFCERPIQLSKSKLKKIMEADAYE